MKIFRFLADILSTEEFCMLSYYHVTKFIDRVVKIATNDASEPLITPQKPVRSRTGSHTRRKPMVQSQKYTLKQFVYNALDLGSRYEASKVSARLMVPFQMRAGSTRSLWHSASQVNVNDDIASEPHKFEIPMRDYFEA